MEVLAVISLTGGVLFTCLGVTNMARMWSIVLGGFLLGFFVNILWKTFA